MRKIELLSPAGNMDSLKAAVIAGCDAVYIGGKLFGARAFSNNFSDEEIIEVIKYCHLRSVKVYVTVNTLIYEKQVDRFIKYVRFLYKNNVDALIIQDLGMMDLILKKFPNLEVHASTQMHIHNLEGVKLLKSLGVKRVVLARESNINLIKDIKQNCDIPLEIFVHGSLCISYSGQCLMSSMIGSRSGNRGSCAGSCRQLYTVDKDYEYLLSTKDLCTLDNIDKLIDIGVDSFKIEGRMKSPEYVYTVTKLYREAIDSYLYCNKVEVNKVLFEQLKMIFNREYTKGFLFKEDNIVNSYRPNHLGIEIGKVVKVYNGKIDILLSGELSINDGIRILDNDIGFTVTKFLNKDSLTCYKDEVITLICDKVNVGSSVVKTTVSLLLKKIKEELKEDKKIPINISIKAKINEPFVLKFNDGENKVEVVGEIVNSAIKQPLSEEQIMNQINRLGNSVYEVCLFKCEIDENVFIPIKLLNEYKRKCIDLLNCKRCYKIDFVEKEYSINLVNYDKLLEKSIYIKTLEQYNLIKEKNFSCIYLEKELFDKIDDERKVLKLNRVVDKYQDFSEKVLIGEVGSLNNINKISDFSLNVTNSYTVAFLHSLGVSKIVLSIELTYEQIKDIIKAYCERYNKHPNLEVIVYGKAEVMISKHIIDFKFLIDRFKNKYPIRIIDGVMVIYNYKVKDDRNDYYSIGVNSIRYDILDEDIKLVKFMLKS